MLGFCNFHCFTKIIVKVAKMNKLKQKEFLLRSLNGKQAIDEKILLPYHYLQQVPGQKTRAKLALAFNYWLEIPESKLNLIVEIVEVIWNFGLLMDDVQDNSELRRGIPVAQKIYGVSATLKASNYAEFVALEKCSLLEHPQAIQICTQQLLRIFRGNGLECYWRDNFICPTEEEYCRIGEMSAGIFTMAVKLMQLFSKNTHDFSKLLNVLGQYYQTRNDYLNLCSEKYMQENKSYCEDITEGKFSFPIIHAVSTSPNSEEILRHPQAENERHPGQKRCVSLIEECGSFQYTRNKLDELLSISLDEVKKFGGNPLLEQYIESISV